VTADEILAQLLTDSARADPYPVYRQLRELGPIAPLTKEMAGVSRFAAVATGYDLIDTVLRDVSFYKQATPGTREHPLLSTFDTSMMFTNPPEHTRMRGLFAKTFTPRRLAAMDPIIRTVVDDRLDQMEQAGAGGAVLDYVEQFASQMPSLVMAAFIGIPVEDLDWYRARVRPIDAFMDLDGKTPDALQRADDAAEELRGYYAGLIEQRRRNPQPDLLTALVASVDAGEHQLSEVELISNLIVLFNASFVTTVFLIGSGLPLLLSRPDVTAALPGNPQLASDCFSEMLRCESPVQFLARSAPADIELDGVPLAQGGVVLLLVGAGNRDPNRFADPDTFDPGREQLPSLGFGAGAHYCIGAAVARAELQIALPRLFERFPRLALAGEPVGSHSLFLRGMTSVPVTLN